jgi:tRNA(adenine34) deaminase
MGGQRKDRFNRPEEGLFTKKAATIARSLASKKVSPKGPASGMRMLTYFINRAGRELTHARRAELEKAKSLLSKRVKREKESKKAA